MPFFSLKYATQEYVVPRSIPMMRPMSPSLPRASTLDHRHQRAAEHLVPEGVPGALDARHRPLREPRRVVAVVRLALVEVRVELRGPRLHRDLLDPEPAQRVAELS